MIQAKEEVQEEISQEGTIQVKEEVQEEISQEEVIQDKEETQGEMIQNKEMNLEEDTIIDQIITGQEDNYPKRLINFKNKK